MSEKNKTTAAAYDTAAQWLDRQASMCDAVENGDPRLDQAMRAKVKSAAERHRGCAAGLRLAAAAIRGELQPATTGKNEQRNEEIIALRSSGQTLAAIGERFGISPEAVRVVIRDKERKKNDPEPTLPTISVRSRNCIANVCRVAPDKIEMKHVLVVAADIGAARHIPNLGRKSMAEISRIAFSHYEGFTA